MLPWGNKIKIKIYIYENVIDIVIVSHYKHEKHHKLKKIVDIILRTVEG